MELVLLEQSDKVSIYSVQKDGAEYSEFEKFLLSHRDDYSSDIARIMYRLDKIKEDGCFDRHFRYAGKYRDRTFELPSKLDTITLRVFCIVLSEHIVILEFEFFHCLLDGVVFGLALLRAALREVEVQLRVVDLSVLLL